MSTIRKITLAAAVLATLAVVTSGCSAQANPPRQANKGGIPQVTVRFGNEPYFDHSQASIGVHEGFFKDVGITLAPAPNGATVNSGDVTSIFASNTYDVLSGSAQILLPAAGTLPPFKIFSLADLFQGYSIMAQPDAGYKSVAEFQKSGLSHGDAVAAAVRQLKGKRFAYPPDAAIKGFINQALSSGGLTVGDTQSNVTDESQTVQAMRSKAADFQVGGVPSHLTLQSDGFKSIVTSGDIAKAAKPSVDSAALTAVFNDGWIATDDWLKSNHDTALRMASVSLRINQMIHDSPDKALAIQLPFVNSIAGTKFDAKTGQVAYDTLDPFLTFKDLNATFNDAASPLNEKYVLGAAIKQAEGNGALPKGKYSASSFSVAAKIYNELVSLKAKSEADIATVQKAIDTGKATDVAAAKAAVKQASTYDNEFDFLDGSRAAEDGLKYVTK